MSTSRVILIIWKEEFRTEKSKKKMNIIWTRLLSKSINAWANNKTIPLMLMAYTKNAVENPIEFFFFLQFFYLCLLSSWSKITNMVMVFKITKKIWGKKCILNAISKTQEIIKLHIHNHQEICSFCFTKTLCTWGIY